MRLTLLFALALLGCTTPPGAAPAPRLATVVQADSDRVWRAAVDELAAENIPTRIADRASGLLASGEVALPIDKANTRFADCGKTIGESLTPTTAEYRVVVRGNTVQASSRWTSLDAAGRTSCVTRGTWEATFEAAVKQRAER